MRPSIIFFNGITFVVSITQNIRVMSINHVPNWEKRIQLIALKKIINIYKKCRLNATPLLMDREFGFLRGDLP